MNLISGPSLIDWLAEELMSSTVSREEMLRMREFKSKSNSATSKRYRDMQVDYIYSKISVTYALFTYFPFPLPFYSFIF